MSLLSTAEKAVASLPSTENGFSVSARQEGRLVALRTKAEVEASLTTVSAYVAEIPIKSASKVLSAIDDILRSRNAMGLQHLRRFVKPTHLPACLEASGKQCSFNTRGVEGSESEQRMTTLYFLVCAASSLSIKDVFALLSSSSQSVPTIRKITVPLLPPISAEQAEAWSRQYWPTTYKNANPYGPHPSIIARAEQEICHQVAHYIGLARSAGESVAKLSKGQNIGAVVVDRSDPQDPRVVAVAGDARWHMFAAVAEFDVDNVLGHAVMRVIGLIARKRQELGETSQEAVDRSFSMTFADDPLTDIERNSYEESLLKPGGYLCLDLEIYLTHEPCVMCSMAILHSRFGKVIFQQRMRETGGITADPDRSSGESRASETGYGLFWRPELNWKLLAWQWVHDDSRPSQLSASGIHA